MGSANSADGRERRQYRRCRMEVRLLVQPVTGGTPEYAQSRDLCSGGARLVLATVYAPGDALNLMIEDKPRGVQLRLRCRVVWCKWQAQTKSHETGVTFVGLSPDQEEGILALLSVPEARERRQFVRLQRQIAVDLRRRWIQHHAGMTENVSCAGMAMTTHRKPALGGVYRATLFLRGDEEPFRARAKVEHVSQASDGNYLVRLAFVSVDINEQHRLGEYLTAEVTRPRRS